MIWQHAYGDLWRFGEEVRGVVRKPYYAEVWYDESLSPSWVWIVPETDISDHRRGLANSFDDAVRLAEAALETFGVELD